MNNTTAYVTTTVGVGIYGNNPRTFSFWIYPYILTDLENLMGYGNGGGNGNALDIRINSGAIQMDGLGGGYSVTSPNILPIRIWSFISAVYDGTQFLIYENGNSSPAATLTKNLTTSANVTFRLGQGIYGVPNPFSGLLDDLMVFNVGLTGAQHKSLFYSGNYPTASLTDRFKMNDGSGTTVVDSVTSANNGSFQGSPAPTWSTNVPLKSRPAVS